MTTFASPGAAPSATESRGRPLRARLLTSAIACLLTCAAATAQQQQPAAQQQQTTITPAFRDADLGSIIEAVSQLTGKKVAVLGYGIGEADSRAEVVMVVVKEIALFIRCRDYFPRREIVIALAVVTLERICEQVPSEAEVQRESRAYLPVVLHEYVVLVIRNREGAVLQRGV